MLCAACSCAFRVVLPVICASCLFSACCVCCVCNVRGMGSVLLVGCIVLCVVIRGVLCAVCVVLSRVLCALSGSCCFAYFCLFDEFPVGGCVLCLVRGHLCHVRCGMCLSLCSVLCYVLCSGLCDCSLHAFLCVRYGEVLCGLGILSIVCDLSIVWCV